MSNMQISIACSSLLLTSALENFLSPYIRDYDSSKVVISDRDIEVDKPLFLIGEERGANLNRPFSKAKLLKELEKFYKHNSSFEAPKTSQDCTKSYEEDYELRAKIETLMQKFGDELYKTISEHYKRA